MRILSAINQTTSRRKYLQAKLLGRQLVKAGLITQTQLSIAINEQKLSGKCLEQILVARGWVKQQEIEELLEQIVLYIYALVLCCATSDNCLYD